MDKPTGKEKHILKGAVNIGGIACRLPNARNAQEFWEGLTSGRDLTEPHRWPVGLYNLPPRIGALPNINRFDNEYFNFSDEKVGGMNPMLWQLLEVVHECVVDSCLPLSTLRASKTGVYLACSASDIDSLLTSAPFSEEHKSESHYLVTELTRWLDVTGPAVTVDTGDSSSLTAVHMAVNDLRQNKCEYAIVAGCNLILNPIKSRQMTNENLLSSDGRSHVFDQSEEGTVRAEGCAALLLAFCVDMVPRVYCLIQDAHMNSGRSMQNETKGEVDALRDLLEEVYEGCGVDTDNIAYIELQGCGNTMDAQRELQCISGVLCGERAQVLPVGSLTSNMGNMEAAAGLAGIIKSILILHHKEIPPNVIFSKDKPLFSEGQEILKKINIVEKSCAVKGEIIGVNSCENGGVNSHVILRAFHPDFDDSFCQVQGDTVVPFTARNIEGVEKVISFVENNRFNTDLLRLMTSSLMSHDMNQPIRGYIHISSKEEDLDIHHDCGADVPEALFLCIDDVLQCPVTISPNVLELDSFMEALNVCSKSIRLIEPDLDFEELFNKGDSFDPYTRQGLLLATAVYISLIDCLEEAGLEFEGVMGCGLSEVVAAYIDGCISLDQCFQTMNCIGSLFEKYRDENTRNWCRMTVDMPFDEVFQLGPYAHFSGCESAGVSQLIMESSSLDCVLGKVDDRGGMCVNTEMDCVPVYTPLLANSVEHLLRDLRDIIPSPAYSSQHLYSSQVGWGSDIEAPQCLIDPGYVARLLVRPCMRFQALSHMAYLGLTLTLTMLRDNIRSLNESSIANTSVGLRYNVASVKHGLDETASTVPYGADTSMVNGVPEMMCQPSVSSLCKTLGELHIRGYNIDVCQLYPCKEDTCGIEMPCLSPLVTWDHAAIWSLPHWLQFSCTYKSERVPYLIQHDEGIHSALSVLVYHSVKAISEEVKMESFLPEGLSAYKLPLLPLRLYNLTVMDDSALTADMCDQSTVHVLPSSGDFSVLNASSVLLKGNFKVKADPNLPCIPGYNLDINENVSKNYDRPEECEKTEICWEDSWLDFINETLEFAIGNLDSTLQEVTFDPVYHHREAKECPSFLAIIEKNTGLCRSGGLSLMLKAASRSNDLELTQYDASLDVSLVASGSSTCLATTVMMYSIHSNQKERQKLLLYKGERSANGKMEPVFGFIDLSGNVEVQDIELKSEISHEELEMCVPYLMAAYLLYDVAKMESGESLLVLPPHDTTAVYMIALACQLGVSVYTCTEDIETLHSLQGMFPEIQVFHGGLLYTGLMAHTRAMGVDICVRMASGGVNEALQCIKATGQLIMCVPPGSTERVDNALVRDNITVCVPRVSQAIRSFMAKSNEDQQALIFNLRNGDIAKLAESGYPESKGLLYSQEEISCLDPPFPVLSLMRHLTGPVQEGALEEVSQTVRLAIQKLQEKVMPIPKDFSMVDTSCLLKNPLDKLNSDPDLSLDPVVNLESRSYTEGSTIERSRPLEDYTMNKGMLETPERSQSGRYSPDVNIITLTDPFLDMAVSPVDNKKLMVQGVPPTSTPMLGTDGLNNDVIMARPLEESYLETHPQETSFHIFKDEESGEVPRTGETTQGSMKNETDKKGKRLESPKPPELEDSTKIGSPKPKIKAPQQQSPRPWGSPFPRNRKTPTIVLTDVDHSDFKRMNSPSYQRPGTPMVKQPLHGFHKHMAKKNKPVPGRLLLPKPRVDLLLTHPPMSPLTNELREVLTPRLTTCVVPLNTVEDKGQPPLFVIHPVSNAGYMDVYSTLGKEMSVPCFGIRKTSSTPTTSVTAMARYYKVAIEMSYPNGPYIIAGYSFAALVAIEIALEFQRSGKQVEKVIVFDGSPLYIQSQLSHDMKHLPPNANQSEVHEALVTGALVGWLSYFRPTGSRLLMYGLMRKLPSTADKIETAVDLTFGNAIVSNTKNKTRWLTAKEKVLQQRRLPGAGNRFGDAAREIVRLMRRDKATEYVAQAQMAYKYRTTEKLTGDIWLYRVKSKPISGNTELPEDYGLYEVTRGNVHVRLYEGQHSSLLTGEFISPLAADINRLLTGTETNVETSLV
ncbi:fatty acid synthase-like [Mya arenaria]|uniref:fatty acid synthase-like n=1 Tax=Mya arenaria TaxID=6604 RepID=UPI0022DF783F|nr:fatty acid synthase-like [Mya arenaria]